jgi:NitT/TauT family transport system substrate-binding protein
MAVRRAARLAIAFACALACAAPAARAAETRINFTLDRRFDAASAPLLLALDQGSFKAAGVNVTFGPASGSQEALERLAAGGYDMGLADLTALIKYRDTHPKAPLEAVFVVDNRPAFAIIGRKSRGIAAPQDLEGKKLGAPAADSSFAQWPIFVKTTGIDAAKVQVENVGPLVLEPMLAAGQVDAITGLTYSSYVDLKLKGVPVEDITVLAMADYGVDLYGTAVIVNTAFAAAHPEAVSGFLVALVKGLKQSRLEPARAIESLSKRRDVVDKTVGIERLKLLLQHNVFTAEVEANGLGGIDPARFARAVDQIAVAYKFDKGKPKLGDIFDSVFLPSEDERAVR